MEIEMPKEAEAIQQEILRECTFTMRALLPQIRDAVELVMEDAFEVDRFDRACDADRYRLRAITGNDLLEKLSRSRIVDGEAILALMPKVKIPNPDVVLSGGTPVAAPVRIELWVRLHKPNEEEE